jgi:Fe-S cluster assembly protein SufD
MNSQATTISEVMKTAQSYVDSLPADNGLWLADQRRAAIDRLFELGLPHKRQEAWRYTGVQGLLEQRFVTEDQPNEVPHAEVKQHFLSDTVAARLVFVDGMFQQSLSETYSKGLRVGSLRGAMAEGEKTILQSIGSLSGVGTHGFSALNLATMQDGAVIHVDRDVKLDQPIELLHISTQSAARHSLRPRHLVILEENANAKLVERYLALEDDISYFNNIVCEILLHERANLYHQRVQQESLAAYHLSEVFLGLQAESHYRGVNAAIGGHWSRTTINNRFTAAGANCELDGLYLAGDDQLVDYHLDVDHAVPGCDSRENFKGILNGQGRAVFDGRILVQEQAQKSNAHLSNANLMLSRKAEIDTKPQLEILADDVQCSHGTTVGQLEPQALFYLRSRGLNELQARRLLCLGFAQEILDRFETDSLREQLTELIRQRIETSGNILATR